jgi:hypothetical protein
MTAATPEERAGIEDLYARYYWALDTGDTDGYGETFTEDAEIFEYRDELPDDFHTVGREGARELVRGYHQDPGFAGAQHRGSQPLIDPDPEGRPDHWRVRAYVFTMHLKPGEMPAILWTGHIDDIVVKTDARYLFKTKKIHPWHGDILSRFPRVSSASTV